MKNAYQIIHLIAVGLIIAAPGVARSEPTEFVRVSVDDQDQASALQVAIVTYTRPGKTGPLRVDLVSAVHIGDSAYYAELNQRFRDYDALLYELVAPQGTVVTRDAADRKGLISNTQLGLTRLLGLSFQLDEVDYDQPNFVHADLSGSELKQSMADRGESLYVYFWRIFYASIHDYAKDPLGLQDLQIMSAALSSGQGGALKTLLAYEMTNLDQLQRILGEDSDSAVIGARNQRAVDVLQRQIEQGERRIGIFYGVAHMPDMEARLQTQLSLAPHKTEWIDAWQLGSPP